MGEYLGYIDVEYDPQGKLFMKALRSILPAQLHYNLIVGRITSSEGKVVLGFSGWG